MYGTQTSCQHRRHEVLFENDVEMYGTQTINCFSNHTPEFENDVEMYGTQTIVGTLMSGV